MKEKFYVASLKGLRPENEDRHFVYSNKSGKNKQVNNIDMACVFDGHGGKKVSEFLYNNVPKYFLDKALKYPIGRGKIREMCETLQNILRHRHRDFSYHSGSTALIALNYDSIGKTGEKESNLIIVNVGDCRAVLCRNNMAYSLTKDHKPDWPEERRRIEQMGGNIIFANGDYRIGDLSVSRAFGDVDNGPYVISEPEIFKHTLTKNDKFIILACDGIWDVLSNQEAVNYVINKCYDKTLNKRINHENISKDLANYALLKGSTDNLSCVVMFLDC